MKGTVKNWLKEQYIYHPIFYILLFVATVLSFVVLSRTNNDIVLLEETTEKLYIKGEYSIDGGETFIPYSSYLEIPVTKGLNFDSLIIRGRVDKDIPKDRDIYMYMENIDVLVSVNDEVVYESNPAVAYGWDAFDGELLKKGDEIELQLTTRSHTAYKVAFYKFLDKFLIGTKHAVLSKAIWDNLAGLIINLVVFMLGFSMIVHIGEIKKLQEAALFGEFACGLTLIFGSIANFLNPEYITLILPRYNLVDYADAIAQFLTVMCLLIYLRRYLSKERYQMYAGVAIVVASAVLIMYMIWRMVGFKIFIPTIVLAIFPGVVIITLYLIMLTKSYLDYRGKENANLIMITVLILVAATLVEMLFYLHTKVYLIKFFLIGLFFFGVGQYIIITKENTAKRKEADRAKELENELMQNRISMMISQIQPHFLYNALGTIRALCTKDPEEARNAMDYFAKYLRANMESIDRKECIPFTKELEHVKSYVYIEQLRFGDLLKVNYEIEATDFDIPAMTVQTLTENAIKHGLLSKQEGGTVTIRTKETANCYEVQIEDDGVGFDATKKLDDSRTHVGIENSRERLAKMCGGVLAIGSKVGVGTVITITIPKNKTE